MTPPISANLYPYLWPTERLASALENLSRHAGFAETPLTALHPPPHDDELSLTRWFNAMIKPVALEVEPVETAYSDLKSMLIAMGPALVRLPGEHSPVFLAILKGNARILTIISPDGMKRSLPTQQIQHTLMLTLEEPFIDKINKLLQDTGIPKSRQPQVARALLHEQLGSVRMGGFWTLRLSPGSAFWKQMRHLGLFRNLVVVFLAGYVSSLLIATSWWLFSQGLSGDHTQSVLLHAWCLVLLTMFPIRIWNFMIENRLALGFGSLIRQRFLYGITKLHPDEIRHQGAGSFLNLVMEAGNMEAMALKGALPTLMALGQNLLAVGVLFMGAGGWLHALSLLVWLSATAFFLWKLASLNLAWLREYQILSNDLLERMVGHRTRLAQEDPKQFHGDEDRLLTRYHRAAYKRDTLEAFIYGVIVQGWMFVGVMGIVLAFYFQEEMSTAALATSMGGVLLAMQSLRQFSKGMSSLITVFSSWKQVSPLFHAASRTGEGDHDSGPIPSPQQVTPQIFDFHHASAHFYDKPFVDINNVHFRHKGSSYAVLDGCNLQIQKGDRLLLEGPSGGGKSTLAAILAGLRSPDAGTIHLWGTDSKTMGVDQWRQHVRMAPQFHENHLFTETFAFNLLMGRGWPPSEKDMQDAKVVCEALNLQSLVAKMPAGFMQMVGESGWRLSHGERSRLFIARTLLQHSDLIILDESLAALDPDNLTQVLIYLLQLKNTLMVIAHP